MRGLWGLLFLAVTAAGASETRSLVSVGTEIPESDEGTRAIVRLDGPLKCTGTFLNPTTLLTAAHCAGTSPSGVPEIVTHGLRSLRVFVNPRHGRYHGPDEHRYRGPHDTAIAVFPDGTGDRIGIRHYYSLAKRVPLPGIAVRFYGYGETSFPKGTGAGVKREGTNHVETIHDGLIGFSGTSRPGGLLPHKSAAASGDSGGPLLDPDGRIAGVASYAESASTLIPSHWNYFTDALGDSSLALYREAIRCGGNTCAADFEGSRVTDPPVDLRARECLDPSAMKRLTRLVTLWESGELPAGERDQLGRLRGRHIASGSCEEHDAAFGAGCLRQAEMACLYRLRALDERDGLPAARLERLKRIQKRLSTWSYCLVP